MASTSSSSNLMITQDFLVTTFGYRRLLLSAPPSLATAPPPNGNDWAAATTAANTTFDANVVMVLSVLLCALICSLGLNSIIKCASRCSSIVSGANRSSSPGSSARLRLAAADTGIKKKALKTFPILVYAADLKFPGLDTDCAICLSEFVAGERVRLLPKCNHGFHARCIDKWLNSHSSCPTCRHCLIQTCEKIVGYNAAAATQPPPPPPAVPEAIVVRIEPLDREGLVPNYRN